MNKRFPTAAAASLLLLLLLPTATASAQVSNAAAEKADRMGFDPREELGDDVSLGRGGADSELFRVELEGGGVLATHGPDARADVEDHGTTMGPGDPERPPACASDNAQHFLYGVPATGVNRYENVVGQIRSIARRMNAVLNEESLASGGPNADFRVLCEGGGQIKVDWFTGPAAGNDSFANVVNAARAAGFDDSSIKYSIFYDTPATQYCGVGSFWSDDRLSADNLSNRGGMYAVTQNSCWEGHTAMHENGHKMGAVQAGAEHSTGRGAHCNDEIDVMCYSPDGGNRNQGGTITLCPQREFYDCNYDDYFDASPEQGEWLSDHWNIGSPLNRFIRFGSTKPANDDFQSAQALNGAEATRTNDTNRDATKEAGEPNHAQNPGGASVWYSWTAPARGPVTIDTQGSDFDTTLAAYTGSPVNALTEQASNDDAAQDTQSSEITFDASAGTTYRIAVDGYQGGGSPATGTIKLRLAQSSVNEYQPIDYARQGTVFSGRGAVSRLFSDDSQRVEITATRSGNTNTWISAIAPYTVITEDESSLEKLTIDYDGHTTGANTALVTAVYNFETEEFELLEPVQTGVSSDRAVHWESGSSPEDYVSPDGAVIALVLGASTQSFRTHTDFAHFEVQSRNGSSSSASREPRAASPSRASEVGRRRATRLLKSDAPKRLLPPIRSRRLVP